MDLIRMGRPYWRVPTVAILGAFLAFAGSFVVEPAYESATRVLIRGRDSTLLNSDGESLAGQPGVIDSNLAVALGETQSGLVSSTAVAEMVVDELHLDEREDDSSGVVGWAKRLFAGAYHRTKAYVTHGFYDEPSDRQRAIDEVHAGLLARPLENSYVLEIRGHADEPELAAKITNAAADALIKVTDERFRTEAATERDFLAGQVERARGEVDAALVKKQEYETANGITHLPREVELSTASTEDLRTSQSTTQVELEGAQAELESVEAQLGRTDRSDRTVSAVQTGRSRTEIESSGANLVYQQLVIKRDELRGQIEGLKAQADAIAARLTGSGSAVANSQETELARLDAALASDQANLTRLEASHQEAVVTAQRPAVEVTRIDEASVPTFPIAPLRYMYLALGLLCGAVAGGALTWLRGRRDHRFDDRSDHRADEWYGEQDTLAFDAVGHDDDGATPSAVPLDATIHGNGPSGGAPATVERRVRVGDYELFHRPADIERLD